MPAYGQVGSATGDQWAATSPWMLKQRRDFHSQEISGSWKFLLKNVTISVIGSQQCYVYLFIAINVNEDAENRQLRIFHFRTIVLFPA